MGRWFRRVLFWFRRRRMADELRQEIETHLALRATALERLGAEDAAATSRRALGNVALALEDGREVWIWPWLDSVARDLRYGARAVWRQPGFAIVSILTISVGTAALASVLAVAHAVLLRPAPYPNAKRIVQIAQVTNGRVIPEVSTVDVLALREGSPSLSHVTIAWFSAASLSGGAFPERARLVYTDSYAFALLGVQPLIGRVPSAADEAPNAEPVVVIGHRLWSERFALDRDVIGRAVRVDGQPHIVIGVMPKDFTFPGPYWARGDLWLLRGPSHPSWPDTRARLVLAFGLVKEGRTIERAQHEVDAVASALDARYPDATGTIGLRLTTWAETVQAAARPSLWLILGAAGVVFLIVCVNVANLLLSRVLDRQRELAARVALGAGRARIVRLLLIETGVLFVIGGFSGVLAAIGGSRLIVSIQSSNIPRMDEASVDTTVTVIAMAITLAAAVIVGLVPALQAPSSGIAGLVEASARGGSRGRRWRRIQRGLVAAEIGLTLVLLCGAGVLLEGARNLARVDPGFDVNGLLHARVSLPPEKYRTPKTQAAFYDRVIDGLLKIPGVIAAGTVNVPPGVGGSGRPSVLLEGDPVPAFAHDLRRANVRVVSPGYFETLGLAPRTGRFFSAMDAPTPVAIVNEAFARQYLNDQVAVGRRVRVTLGRIQALDPLPRTIVGIVADLKEKTLYEPTPPTIYVPLSQSDATRMALLVRSGRSIGELMPAVRTAIMNVDPDLAAAEFMAMGDLMQNELSLNRLNLALLSVLATISLFLAVIGVYGLTAHVVRQRTREIGIRMALGSSPASVRRLLLGEGSALVVIGVACGGGAAIWSAGLLRSLVHGIDHTSASTFLWAGLVLAAAVLAGCYVPARRAARIDPSIVLRSE
jgi:putative ABC transport system permease protein